MLVGKGFDLPEEVRDKTDFHWMHVPVGGSLNLCLLPADPVWYVAHWLSGRMLPCEGQECKLCAKSLGTQIRYVFAVVEISTRRSGLIELGKTNGLQIRDWGGRDGYPTFATFEVYRPGRNKNSRLDVRRIEENVWPWCTLVPVPDHYRALQATWDRSVQSVHTR
jgi:hypothetical protein